MAGEAALPEILGLPEPLPHPAREHEEEVAQPVHVLERPRRDRLDAREREHSPLGTAAHRARLMEEAADAAAAGEDEGLERLEVLLALVHELLEGDHLRL